MPTTRRSDARLTYDDFVLFPDDGKRHEIIGGVHYVTPSPLLRHQVVVGRLHLALGNYLASRPQLGRVFLSPLDVVLSHYDVVEPDLLFVSGDQFDILTEKNIWGAPALVIEVLSKSTRRRDETIKQDLFARTGVREYWLVDPERNTVRVFRRASDDGFARSADLSRREDDVLTSPLLPGFALSLNDLLAVGSA
jgi:Uma2 family endonuclease